MSPIEKYTINIEPVDDHLVVTIPEISASVITTGTTRTEAIDAAHRAITAHVLNKRKPRGTRTGTPRHPQAS